MDAAYTRMFTVIETKQNSTIAQLSGIQHKIIRFFLSVFTRNHKKKRYCQTWSILKMICPEASKMML